MFAGRYKLSRPYCCVIGHLSWSQQAWQGSLQFLLW